MLKLTLTDADGSREILVTDQPMTIGRSADCEIKITDLKSSRRHARIERFEGSYRVCDLETQNGTLVNGKTATYQFLGIGDEVRIGDTTLRVTETDAPPPPETGVPLEKKLELKNRIDEIRERTVRRASPVKTGIAVVLAVGAAAGALIVLAAALRENKPTAPRVDDPLAEARQARARLEEKVRAATAVTPELIAEANAAGTKWTDLWLKHSPEKATSPFDKIASDLLTRRAEQFAAAFDAARQAVLEAIEARNYASALQVLGAFRASADPSFEDAVRALVEDVDNTVDIDFKAVDAMGREMEDGRRYDEAGRYYQQTAPRFKGTTYYARIADKPESLAALSKAEKIAIEKRHQEELARAEAVRKENAMAAAVPASAGPDAPPVPVKLTPFLSRISDLANAGKFATRPTKFNDATTGPATAAAPEGLVVGDKTVAWSAVAPEAFLKLASEFFAPEDLILAAEFGYANGLAADADRLLVRFAAGAKDRQPKVDEILARVRGLAAVPEGGFQFTDKSGWEDRTQRANRTAYDEAARHLKLLVSDAKKRDDHFKRFMSVYSQAELSTEIRDRIRAEAIAKLKAWKKKSLDDVTKKAKNAGAFAQLKGLREELNRRRAAAIKLIYDAKIYLPEDDPRWGQGDKINGQEQVDKLVGDVRQVWENPMQVIFADSESIKHDIEEVQKVNQTYLQALGEEVDTEAELKEVEETINNLNSRISVKTYCINSRENELLNFGRRVDRYNEAMTDPAVGQSGKNHARSVNDYREMMGRRRLFLDARLCRATTKHSAECNKAQKIWHVGSDGSPGSRAQAEGFSGGVGENVCLGYADGDTWTRGWYRASDHHRNGLNESWNCLGYGYVGNVGTENFANIGTPKGF